MSNSKIYKTIDLFAGAGGLTEGFRREGFQAVYANEFEKNAAATCQLNHPDTLVSCEDIIQVSAAEVRKELSLDVHELDVLVGGPPCQGFSTYGQRDDEDPRNKLYMQFIKFLGEFRPKTYVIENVEGLLSMSGGAVLNAIISDLENLGYGAQVHLLNAVDFGVPQKRKRVFILGGLDGEKISVPVQTHSEIDKDQSQIDLLGKDTLRSWLNVSDAISDLSLVDPMVPKDTQLSMSYPDTSELTDYQKRMRVGSDALSHHSSKQMLGIRRLRLAMMHPGDYGRDIAGRIADKGLPYEIIDKLLTGSAGVRDYKGCRKQDVEKEMKLREMLHEGKHDLNEIMETLSSGGFANKYRRLHWDSPSHTVVAHMARDCSDFVHPDQDRFISVRESARLQSFQDSYRFVGSQFQQFKQIGNAVPPELGSAIARKIKQVLGESLLNKAA